jgi:hypothetical protein
VIGMLEELEDELDLEDLFRLGDEEAPEPPLN